MNQTPTTTSSTTRLALTQTLAARGFTRDRIMGVYSGQEGCACGCRGIYRYAAQHTDAAGRTRGYAIGAEEINERQITRVFNVLLSVQDVSELEFVGDRVALTRDGKLYIVFLAPSPSN